MTSSLKQSEAEQDKVSTPSPSPSPNCNYKETFYVEYCNNTYGPFEHRCVLPSEHSGNHKCNFRKVIGKHSPESPAIIFDLLTSPK